MRWCFLLLALLACRANKDKVTEFDPVEAPHWDKPDNTQDKGISYSTKTLIPITPENLPSLVPSGNLETFIRTLENQINFCKRLNSQATWTFASFTVTRKKWCIETLGAFVNLAKESDSYSSMWQKAKEQFLWFKSIGSDNEGKVLFTGYYLPTLYAQKVPDFTFNYPLYSRPYDLTRVLINGSYRWRKRNSDGTYSKYWNRYEIDWENSLAGYGTELAWVDDPITAFFLHIQGSGILLFENADGSTNRKFINYAAQNGHSYVSIGKILKEEGVSYEYYSSLQGLKRYFMERPEEIDRVFPMNPSYIFFSAEENGPYGSTGILLTPEYSIATDSKLFAPGALALVLAAKPILENGEIIEWQRNLSFKINQDTGGAIKGPGRVDIYWGEGDYAELAAGNLKHYGELYFPLLP